MKLNDEQKEFFSAMENLFRQPGWALLKRGWETERAGLAETVFFNAKSLDDVERARERYGFLNEMITLPLSVDLQRGHIEDEDLDDV
jgi:hypothetical protein